MESRKVSGPPGGVPSVSEMGKTAAQHGRELSSRKFTVEQVVHDYGDLCQSITDLAVERNEPVDVDEFRTLNRCLDDGIAEAVTAFAHHRSDSVERASASSSIEARENAEFFATELKNYLHVATHALAAIMTGRVGATGATGAVLDRCLNGMRTLVDRSLAEVRTTVPLVAQDAQVQPKGN